MTFRISTTTNDEPYIHTVEKKSTGFLYGINIMYHLMDFLSLSYAFSILLFFYLSFFCFLLLNMFPFLLYILESYE